MAKDLIIGAVSNYDYDAIKTWFRSIKKSGFDGKTALVVYNMDIKTAERLNSEGLDYIFGFAKDDQGNLTYNKPMNQYNVVVERFVHMWYFLNQIEEDIGYVITTDVKDVVFQSNPSEWLRKNNIEQNIIVGAENLTIEDEPWNQNNVVQSFGPMIYETIKGNPIFCAGVIAGERQAFADLCLHIYLLCRGSQPYIVGGGGPDQAALNILVSTEPYFSTTHYTTPNDSFMVHAGTSTAAIKAGVGGIGEAYLRNPSLLDTFKENFLYDDCQLINDQVCNSKGEPYCIVHQYDRVPQWKPVIEKRYNES